MLMFYSALGRKMKILKYGKQVNKTATENNLKCTNIFVIKLILTNIYFAIKVFVSALFSILVSGHLVPDEHSFAV